MAKAAPPQIDVLVLGDHPCAYLAATLLKEEQPSIHVAHATMPGEQLVDRLVIVNPEFFDLHPALGAMKRKLDLAQTWGLKFLADDAQIATSHAAKSIGAYVGSFKQIHAAMAKLAEDARVEMRRPKHLEIQRLDETGLYITIDGATIHPKLLILAAGELSIEQKRLLGLPLEWEKGVLHRYTFLRMKSGRYFDPAAVGGRPLIPMSLDLRGTLHWAWLLPGPGGQIQLAIEQPIDQVTTNPPAELMRHWISILIAHGMLKHSAAEIDCDAAVSLDLPLSGALSQEGVANRTLLIGPAGGFYTACAEDIYPNCWSAVHAADVAKKALKEKHVQDALQPYRQRWGATLGDYLRGPQQNLRFLLPLVYRNATMTARLTEAILSGKSVVR